MKDLVVVGAGPAGCAAAVQCSRLGVAPLLLDRTGEAGGLVANAWSMENHPGMEPMDGTAYVWRLRAHLDRFDVKVEAREVRGIRRDEHGLALETDCGLLAARSVILAVGTSPRRLDVPGAEALEGSALFYEVRDLLRRGARQAVVIGGGEMAFDYALSLARAGSRVELLVRGSKPRARGRLAEYVAREPGISLHLGVETLGLALADGSAVVTAASGNGRETIRCDGVVVAIGRLSALDRLGGGLDLSPTGMVSTRVPGLFVAGDARLGSLGQAGIAVGDGLEAAMQAVGFLDREDGCSR